uniref:Protein kinase domain-containing protein n=1 Tax=Seriola lalandi dorsalis TaxID=1841481 RepID=A0A3B4XFA8_SERLL
MSNNSKLFYVEKYLGHGSYGKVAQCTRLDTNEKIAVKILRSDMSWAGKREAAVLKKIRKLDHDKNNLVKFHESFEYKGHICLTFEMLHLSIYDFMSCRDFKPMHLTEIRVITQQMLVALNALKSIGLSHADIKPDNIMLVNQKHFPFRVKLIDFGLADNVSKLPTGTMIQATGYRAPEVILGLPLDQGVDIWSLACVLGFMYLGRNLYPTRCSYQVMRVIVELQGMPDDDLLDTGIYTSWFFSKNDDSSGRSWRLNTDMKDTTEYEDTLAYLSLLKRMLHVDPRKRITTIKAMGHRFINMKHFPNDANPNPYMSAAFLTIKKSQLKEPSVKFKHFVTSSEVVSFKEESLSSFDDSSSSDEDTASCSNDNNNRPLEKAGLDVATAAETNKKPPGSNEINSPTPVPHVPDGDNANTNKGSVVEVKTMRRFLKRIRQFFSWLMKRNFNEDRNTKQNENVSRQQSF